MTGYLHNEQQWGVTSGENDTISSISMEEQVNSLVQKVWKLYLDLPKNERILVAVAGIPGSGKTTLAAKLVERLNALHYQADDRKSLKDGFPDSNESKSASNEDGFAPSSEAPISPINSPTTSGVNPSATNMLPPAPPPGKSIDRSPLLPRATAIPMDGFHYSRAHLATMPDPEFAVFRRGAPFTFDSEGYLKLVKRLREPISVVTDGIGYKQDGSEGERMASAKMMDDKATFTAVDASESIKGDIIEQQGNQDDDDGTIYAPSFSHAIKDPVDNDIPIPSTSPIVVLEGLYLLLDDTPPEQPSSSSSISSSPPATIPVPGPPNNIISHTSSFAHASSLFDLLIFIEVDEPTAMKRLIRRHVESGVSKDEEEARRRVEGSDLLNGREILGRMVRAGGGGGGGGGRGGEVVKVRSWEVEGGWG